MQSKFVGGVGRATHKDGREGEVIATDELSFGVMTPEGLAIWPRADVLRVTREVIDVSDTVHGEGAVRLIDGQRFEFVESVFLAIGDKLTVSGSAAATLTLAYFQSEANDAAREIEPTRIATEYEGA